MRLLSPGFLALLLLSACGGGEGGAPTPDEPTVRLDALSVPIALGALGSLTQDRTPPTYDPQADSFTFAPKTFTWFLSGERVLNRVSDDMMPADFAAYNDGTSGTRGVRGVKSGGAAYAIRRQNDGFYMGYERFGDTELPTTGRGVFNGTYAGTIGDVGAENRGTITGLVLLEVDFEGSDIQGAITDRINQNNRLFEPVDLRITRMQDGLFANVTSGGQSPFLGHRFATGRYHGAIVGTTGNQIVGTLDIQHSSSDTREDLIEAGAFVAERR